MGIVLINKIVSSIMQIFLFALIPLIWWFVTAKRNESFFKWIGLKKVDKENKKRSISIMLVITLVYIMVSFITLYLIKDIKTATSEFNVIYSYNWLYYRNTWIHKIFKTRKKAKNK